MVAGLPGRNEEHRCGARAASGSPGASPVPSSAGELAAPVAAGADSSGDPGPDPYRGRFEWLARPSRPGRSRPAMGVHGPRRRLFRRSAGARRTGRAGLVAGDASSWAGLAMLGAVALFAAPWSIWLRYSRQVNGAGGLSPSSRRRPGGASPSSRPGSGSSATAVPGLHDRADRLRHAARRPARRAGVSDSAGDRDPGGHRRR